MVSRLILVAAVLVARPAFAQIDAGYLADVQDLKTTVAYTADNHTEVSLALAPPMPAGGPGVTFIFRARFEGRSTDPDRLSDLVIRTHYRVLSDDRRRARLALDTSQQLEFRIDPEDPTGIALDFYPENWGYGGFSPPGDEIPVAYFAVTAADLRALAMAKSVSGQVLWTRFTFTPEELDALRAFVRQVLPPAHPAT